MAGRAPKPWYWEARSAWFVTIKGERHRLGADKVLADREFHRLMSVDPSEPETPAEQGREWLYASEVTDDFQIFLQAERSESTLDWYCQYLDPFKEKFMTVRADKLSGEMVRTWVQTKWPTQPSRRAAMRAVKAAFRKAVNDGRLPYSPLASMSLPGETARDYVVNAGEYKKILAEIKDETFTDLIRFTWITGARPQETLQIETSHVDLKNSRIVLPPKLVKGKKRVRVILLSPDAKKLVKTKLGDGKLFKNLKGKPYTKDMVRMRFRSLETKLNFRYCLYHFRHGFAHRSLAAGNDAVTVATLLGHSSISMIVRVYGHMNQADQHLRAALIKTK